MFNLVHREFEVNVAADAAWKHLAQVEAWPSWAKHIRRVQLTPAGNLTPQSSGRFDLSNGIQSTFKMVEMDYPQHWKWIGRFLWMMVHYDHRFEPVDDHHSRLIWIVEAEGLGVSIFGRLYGVVYNRNLDRAIPNLVAELNAKA